MSEITQERWAFGSALHVENPAVGKFIQDTRYTGVELNQVQNNWLVCSVPAPSPLEGWRIKTLMIVFNIRNTQGDFGRIDKLGIRDGFNTVYGFENLNLVRNPNWEIRRFPLPNPTGYKMGLGVSIHLDYPEIIGSSGQWPTQFLFTSIGLEFSKPS